MTVDHPPPYDRADRANECYLVRDDSESEIILSGTYEPVPDFDKPDDEERYLSLSLIPRTEDIDAILDGSQHEVAELNRDGTTVRRDYWENAHLGIGAYLLGMEQHRYAPSAVLESLESHAESVVESYRTWLDRLDESDRRRLLFGLGEKRMARFEEASHPRLHHWNQTIKTGEWRATGLDSETEAAVTEAVHRIESFDPRSCFYTTQQVYRELDRSSVQYVEGVALPEHTGEPVEHAWLEIDGTVTEVTWPAHLPDGRNAVYYGTPIPADTVAARLQNRRLGAPMLLDASEYN